MTFMSGWRFMFMVVYGVLTIFSLVSLFTKRMIKINTFNLIFLKAKFYIRKCKLSKSWPLFPG